MTSPAWARVLSPEQDDLAGAAPRQISPTISQGACKSGFTAGSSLPDRCFVFLSGKRLHRSDRREQVDDDGLRLIRSVASQQVPKSREHLSRNNAS